MLLEIIISSDVFGTVSDWVMIGVTIVTAFFHYKTFKSQKEVQQVQNELFKIEGVRFKESIKPSLKYSASTDIMMQTEKDKKILTIQVLNETNNIALNISKILSQNEFSKQIFIAAGLSIQQNHLVKGDKPLLYHFLIDHKSNWTIFELNYEDIYATKYKQKVICICDNFGIEINPYLPEVI